MTTGTPLALAGGVFMLSGERLAREECRFQMQRLGSVSSRKCRRPAFRHPGAMRKAICAHPQDGRTGCVFSRRGACSPSEFSVLRNDLALAEELPGQFPHHRAGPGGFAGEVLPIDGVKGGEIRYVGQEASGLPRVLKAEAGGFQDRPCVPAAAPACSSTVLPAASPVSGPNAAWPEGSSSFPVRCA